MATEFGQVMRDVDLGELMRQFLDGRSIEVTAKIRFSDDADDDRKADSKGDTQHSKSARVDFQVRSD